MEDPVSFLSISDEREFSLPSLPRRTFYHPLVPARVQPAGHPSPGRFSFYRIAAAPVGYTCNTITAAAGRIARVHIVFSFVGRVTGTIFFGIVAAPFTRSSKRVTVNDHRRVATRMTFVRRWWVVRFPLTERYRTIYIYVYFRPYTKTVGLSLYTRYAVIGFVRVFISCSLVDRARRDVIEPASYRELAEFSPLRRFVVFDV